MTFTLLKHGTSQMWDFIKGIKTHCVSYTCYIYLLGKSSMRIHIVYFYQLFYTQVRLFLYTNFIQFVIFMFCLFLKKKKKDLKLNDLSNKHRFSSA